LSSFSEIPEVSASPLLHTQREHIRVLVAEPDIASRRLISSLLACESEITAKYIDGSRLVSSVRESFPDLVILNTITHNWRMLIGPVSYRSPLRECLGNFFPCAESFRHARSGRIATSREIE
jgi:hypothetical protein